MAAVLALDIDGTIDTANKQALADLKSFAIHRSIPIHINTARPAEYCETPSRRSTSLCAKRNHHCLRSRSVTNSKVMNMQRIAQREGVRPECAILIDDLRSNVNAVRKAGFSAIKVNGRLGIQPSTVSVAKKKLLNCIGSVRSRGSANGVRQQASNDGNGFLRHRRNVMRALLVTVAIFMIAMMILYVM